MILKHCCWKMPLVCPFNTKIVLYFNLFVYKCFKISCFEITILVVFAEPHQHIAGILSLVGCISIKIILHAVTYWGYNHACPYTQSLYTACLLQKAFYNLLYARICWLPISKEFICCWVYKDNFGFIFLFFSAFHMKIKYKTC